MKAISSYFSYTTWTYIIWAKKEWFVCQIPWAKLENHNFLPAVFVSGKVKKHLQFLQVKDCQKLLQVMQHQQPAILSSVPNACKSLKQKAGSRDTWIRNTPGPIQRILDTVQFARRLFAMNEGWRHTLGHYTWLASHVIRNLGLRRNWCSTLIKSTPNHVSVLHATRYWQHKLVWSVTWRRIWLVQCAKKYLKASTRWLFTKGNILHARNVERTLEVCSSWRVTWILASETIFIRSPFHNFRELMSTKNIV